MKSLFSSPTCRRGYSTLEVIVASSLTVMMLSAVLGVLTTGGRIQQFVSLKTDTDQGAQRAMGWMTSDLLPAREVQVLGPGYFRIHYATLRANGHYDRPAQDTKNYVDYMRADSKLKRQDNGTFLVRTKQGGQSRVIARNVAALDIATDSVSWARVSITLDKRTAIRQSTTRLHKRTIYLRNAYSQ